MRDGFVPVAGWKADTRPPEHPVAARGGVSIAWERFTRDVAGLAAALDRRGPGRWVLFAEDAYRFSVGLLGVWQAGGVAVLPPNGEPGTLRWLAGDALGVLADPGSAVPGVLAVDPLAGPKTPPVSWAPLDRQAVRLELYTSGSSGPRRPVVKRLAHLDDEVAELERLWGTPLRGRRAVATVSHQHIYGLLFRVLWPLAAGRVLQAETVLHPGELAVLASAAVPSYLVSTPAHLRRVAASGHAAALAPWCGPIFSSGGPLEGGIARRLEDAIHAPVLEVFGSTETGGVAWRRQAVDVSAAWTPFDAVRVAVEDGDDLLRVVSPFVSADDQAFTMADRAEMRSDGRFTVSGRADRVVKVGGKRLSLPDMEAMLAEHPWVSAAGLVVLEQAGEPRVAAVVVPSAAGQAALAGSGRRAVARALGAHLAPHWDRVLLPRSWRYVDRLPEDAQGKTTARALADAFSPAPLPGSAADGADTVAVRSFRVAHDLPALAGHFPGLPVVPGFVQVQWVMEAAQAMAGRALVLERIEALKFTALLRPGDAVELELRLGAGARTASFRLGHGGTRYSSGRCRLAPAPPGDP